MEGEIIKEDEVDVDVEEDKCVKFEDKLICKIKDGVLLSLNGFEE